jgi:hypothetical protein
MVAGVATTAEAELLLVVDIQPVDIHQPQAAARAVANATTHTTTTTATDVTNSTFSCRQDTPLSGGVFFVNEKPRPCGRAIAPDSIAGRRRDMVPAAPMLVVGHDDERMSSVWTSPQRLDDVRHVLLTLQQVGIAGMLVIGTERLDKGDRGQVVILQIEEEVGLILTMSGGNQVPLAVPPRSIVVVVGKRLIVPLEKRSNRWVRRNHTVVRRIAGRTGQRIVPSAEYHFQLTSFSFSLSPMVGM